MVRYLGEDRVYEAHIVDALAEMRKYLAYFFAALSIFLESEWRFHQRAGLALMLEIAARHRLPVILGQCRLGIEAVDLRQAAIHEEKDHVLGARLESRLLDH